jgi:hypothetical protein
MLALTARTSTSYISGSFDSVAAFRAALIEKFIRGFKARTDVEMEFQLIAESVSDPDVFSAVKAAFDGRESLFAEILSSFMDRKLISKTYVPAHGARRLNAIFVGSLTRNYFLNDDRSCLAGELIDAEFALMGLSE